jgi:hypothetical protein
VASVYDRACVLRRRQVRSLFSPHVVIVVPTRNRADLAQAAVRSLATSGVPGMSVLVSDNSTIEGERTLLRDSCKGYRSELVTYLRPPEPMSMTAHWSWALEQALQHVEVTHVVYLTDRMMFKPGELEVLFDAVTRRPDKVIAYNHDLVDDDTRPVKVVMNEWTGRLYEVESAQMIGRAARGVFHNAVPRMLNSVTPRAVLSELASRFGSVFGSISPDYCFCYRVLATVESFIYLDRSCIVHYATDRSHGANLIRGRYSESRADFMRDLGGITMNASAPIPELLTDTNAVFNEYCFVRGEVGADRMPPIVMRSYLGIASRQLHQFESPARREQTRQLLKSRGWNSVNDLLFKSGRRLEELRFYAARPGTLARRLRGAGPHCRYFDSTQAALQYVFSGALAPTSDEADLRPLLQPRGHARAVDSTIAHEHDWPSSSIAVSTSRLAPEDR